MGWEKNMDSKGGDQRGGVRAQRTELRDQRGELRLGGFSSDMLDNELRQVVLWLPGCRRRNCS
jgi:hypothetical protein